MINILSQSMNTGERNQNTSEVNIELGLNLHRPISLLLLNLFHGLHPIKLPSLSWNLLLDQLVVSAPATLELTI